MKRGGPQKQKRKKNVEELVKQIHDVEEILGLSKLWASDNKENDNEDNKESTLLDVSLPINEELSSLSEDQKIIFLEQVSQLGLRISVLLSSLISVRSPNFALLLKDLRFPAHVEGNKQLVSLGAWQSIIKFSLRITNLLDSFIQEEEKQHLVSPKIVPSLQFHQQYIKSMTNSFSEEIEELRKAETFNSRSVHLLAETIKTDTEKIFGDLEKKFFVEWLQSQKFGSVSTKIASEMAEAENLQQKELKDLENGGEDIEEEDEFLVDDEGVSEKSEKIEKLEKKEKSEKLEKSENLGNKSIKGTSEKSEKMEKSEKSEKPGNTSEKAEILGQKGKKGKKRKSEELVESKSLGKRNIGKKRKSEGSDIYISEKSENLAKSEFLEKSENLDLDSLESENLESEYLEKLDKSELSEETSRKYEKLKKMENLGKLENLKKKEKQEESEEKVKNKKRSRSLNEITKEKELELEITGKIVKITPKKKKKIKKSLSSKEEEENIPKNIETKSEKKKKNTHRTSQKIHKKKMSL